MVLLTLPSREEKIIRMKLGIGEKRQYTLEDIGQIFGLSVDAISGHIEQAKAKLLDTVRAERLPQEFKERLGEI